MLKLRTTQRLIIRKTLSPPQVFLMVGQLEVLSLSMGLQGLPPQQD